MKGYRGIVPVECKVLILPDEVKDKGAGGLYIPESVREREQYAIDRGTVMAVGEGFFSDMPGPVPQIGDKVVFNKYAGSLMMFHEEDGRKSYRLCRDEDIIAIIEEEDNGRSS